MLGERAVCLRQMLCLGPTGCSEGGKYRVEPGKGGGGGGGGACISPCTPPSLLALCPTHPPLCTHAHPCSYVYQEHYSCGGHYWVYCAHRIVVCLGVMSAFTAGGNRGS